MKVLIPILIGLLVVGCGKKESTSTSEKVSKTASAIEPTWETPPPTEPYIAKRNLKPEDVIGIYEKQVEEGNIFRIVFLKEGSMEFYSKGEKLDEDSVLGSNKWRIEGSEIRTSNKDGNGVIYTIENNGDLTLSGLFGVLNGRINYSKDELDTYNRVKGAKPTSGKKETPSKDEDNNSTTSKPAKELTLEEKFVGSYEWGETGKVHFLENGKAELYIDGKRTFEWKWKIVGNEVHAAGDLVAVYRIETTGDLTQIAEIEGGKRTDFPKGQMTLKKIK
jgi:hypothetical protein